MRLMTDAEVRRLRAEIERLVAVGVQADLDHADALERVTALHADDLVALADLHHAEIERMDAANAAGDEHFKRALATRDVIGQAKGVLMTTLGCDADKAFAILVTQSQHENRKLAEIAAEIAARVVRPTN
jgi:AmiR/NasT family two-component response regulator